MGDAARKLDLSASAPDSRPAGIADDPLWRAFLNAPVGAAMTERERAALGESERLIAAGVRGASQAEIEALLERRRIEHGDDASDDDVDP